MRGQVVGSGDAKTYQGNGQVVHDAEQNVPQRNYGDGDYELSGEIPPWLGSLSNLTYLDLSFNKLSGCVPNSLEDQLNYLIGLPFC